MSEIYLTDSQQLFSAILTVNLKNILSYDVAVFQWITSCHKNSMTTRVITRIRTVIDNVRVNNASFSWNNFHFEGH